MNRQIRTYVSLSTNWAALPLAGHFLLHATFCKMSAHDQVKGLVGRFFLTPSFTQIAANRMNL